MTKKSKLILAFILTLVIILIFSGLYLITTKKEDLVVQNENIEQDNNLKNLNIKADTWDRPDEEIKNENNAEIHSINKKEWPIEKLEGIKEPNNAVIDNISENSDQIIVTFEVKDLADVRPHLANVKNQGYKTKYEIYGLNNISYEGTKAGKIARVSCYETGLCSTTLVKVIPKEDVDIIDNAGATETTETKKSENNRDNIREVYQEPDKTDNAPWPKEVAKEIPEIDGKIVKTLTEGNIWAEVTVHDVTQKSIDRFITDVISNGYTKDASHDITRDYTIYKASNSKNENISIYYSVGGIVVVEFGERF